MKDQPIEGATIGEITFRPMSTGFGIFHKDGYHLTVCVNKYTQKFDIHLTRENPYEQTHSPLRNFGPEDFEKWGYAFASKILRLLFQKLKRAKPDWLAKRGYFVCAPPESKFKDAFRQHSPIRKKKYRPDLRAIAKTLAADANEWFYTPGYLHTKDAKNLSGPVFAHSFSKKFRKEKLVLIYWGRFGKDQWYAFRQKEILNLGKDLFTPNQAKDIQTFLENVFEKIPFEKLFADFDLWN